MRKRYLLLSGLSLAIFAAWNSLPSRAQREQSDIHVAVNMVQVNIAVTDNKGNYVAWPRPEDFITEDAIPEKIATFEEGNEPARRVENDPAIPDPNVKQANSTGTDVMGGLASEIAGSNVFILSTPAITCIGASFLLKMQSLISSVRWRRLTRSRSIHIAAIFHVRRR
jgi:hypothetical protein